MPKDQTLKTIITLLIVGVIGFLIWKLSAIIILIIVAAILAATLSPAVKWLEDSLSKKIAAALVLVVLFLPFVLVLVLIVPVFLNQIDNIAAAISGLINNFPFLPKVFQNLDITQYTKEAGQYLWASTAAFTNFIAQLVILIFMTYYLLIDSASLHNFLLVLIPKKHRKQADKALMELTKISGQYIRGNLFISVICTVTVFIGLVILQVPGAAALAIFAGILDLLPLIGATVGAVPAIILGFAVSPLTGILVLILFIIYQQIENDILIPRVYHRALKLIPFLSFITVIIGAMLFGVAGAFLALPIAASLPTIIHYLGELKRN